MLAEQRRYYEARASEYDDWWYRRGRYDEGPESNFRWHQEAAALKTTLESFAPQGNVLEIACGTGIWTEQLIRHANTVTAIDASQTMLSLNKTRNVGAGVTYVLDDIFNWQPTPTYDVCFFAFWLSHVPNEIFSDFWLKVRAALLPAGRFFFIDSAGPSKWDGEHGSNTVVRQLADGRRFQIVKRFLEPLALQDELSALGFAASVKTTGRLFVYGEGRVL